MTVWARHAIGMAIVCGAVFPNISEAQSNSCQVNIDSVGGTGRQIELSQQRFRYHMGGGVWAHCIGQLTQMRSDSVAGYSEFHRLDMLGDVWFQDTSVVLTSDRAVYFLADERLEAYGNVILTNRTTGSSLSGPNLTYYRKVVGLRDSAEVFATGRPTVEYRSEEDPRAEPYVIIGDRIRFRGSSAAWVGGNVDVTRSDLTAHADSATLDASLGDGQFIGDAQITGGDSASYDLAARSIRFRIEENELTWVQARSDARAASEAWSLTADTLEFELAGGLIESGIAWGDSVTPAATSADYVVTSDSLEIDTPDQVLQELRAYGDALARSATTSSEEESDWVSGELLTVQFDSDETGKRIIRTLDAEGDARAFYKLYGESSPSRPGINYSRGDRIIARFGSRGIEQVDVFGNADGVYLEPDERLE